VTTSTWCGRQGSTPTGRRDSEEEELLCSCGAKQSGGKEGQREGKDTTARLGAVLVQRRPTQVSWTLSRRGPADWSGLV